MSFEDKINDAVKEGNLNYIGNLKDYKHQTPNLAEAFKDYRFSDEHQFNPDPDAVVPTQPQQEQEQEQEQKQPQDKNKEDDQADGSNYSELIGEGYTVEGDARRPALMRLIYGAIKRKKRNQALETVKDFCKKWNQNCCKPVPLSDQEFEECWNEVLNRKEQENEQNKKFYEDFFDNKPGNELLEQNFPELKDNVYYRINLRPAKFIVAFKGTNHLIEIEAGLEKSYDKDGHVQLERTTKHNRTFLTCIPTEMKRHLNPFMHLEPEDAAPKYSITFVHSTGERHKFPHKTLAGTMSNLKELGYVNGDGAENPLGLE